MTAALHRGGDIRDQVAASLRLSLVRVPSAAEAAGEHRREWEVDAMRAVCSDPASPGHPPPGLLFDLLRAYTFGAEAALDPSPLPDPDLDGAYRLRVLAPLLRLDGATRSVSNAARARSAAERPAFLRLLAAELVAALARFAELPFDDAWPDLPSLAELDSARPTDAVVRAQLDALRAIVLAWPRGRPLLCDQQIRLLGYARTEADRAVVGGYLAACAILVPAAAEVASPACRTAACSVEVERPIGPPLGGYAGLRAGTTPDDLPRLVPSEWARMEPGEPVDPFALDLFDGRLLSFSRTHAMGAVAERTIRFVFLDPRRFDFRPAHLPARWHVVFLAAALDLVRFHRERPALRRDRFEIVAVREEVAGGGLRPCDDLLTLVELVRRRDLPGAPLGVRSCNASGRARLYERCGGHDVIFELAAAGQPAPGAGGKAARVPIRFRTSVVDHVSIGPVEGSVATAAAAAELELTAATSDQGGAMLSTIRDAMMLLVAGERAMWGTPGRPTDR